jgi:hypothetical protein
VRGRRETKVEHEDWFGGVYEEVRQVRVVWEIV